MMKMDVCFRCFKVRFLYSLSLFESLELLIFSLDFLSSNSSIFKLNIEAMLWDAHYSVYKYINKLMDIFLYRYLRRPLTLVQVTLLHLEIRSIFGGPFQTYS
jgi:hypothetical protein